MCNSFSWLGIKKEVGQKFEYLLKFVKKLLNGREVQVVNKQPLNHVEGNFPKSEGYGEARVGISDREIGSRMIVVITKQ